MYITPTQRCSRLRPSGKEQSWEGGGIENKHHLGGALDQLEVHSILFGPTTEKDSPPLRPSALPQSGRMGPPNYSEQRTVLYDGLHKKREGGRARADRRPRPARQAPPHQGRDPEWYALWEWVMKEEKEKETNEKRRQKEKEKEEKAERRSIGMSCILWVRREERTM